MNWKDIKNLIKEELKFSLISRKRAIAALHQIKSGKRSDGMGEFTDEVYGYTKLSNTPIKITDLKDIDKYDKFGLGKSEVNESTTVDAGGSKFNLRTGVNKNPTKLGIKIQFEPKGGMLDTDTKAKLEVALQEKLNVALAEYDMQISKDTDVPRPEVIGFFIPLAQIKNLIVKSLTGQKVDAPTAAAPEPEGEKSPEGDVDSEIDEMIRTEMLNEMKVRDLNEASSIVDKDDFYSFINAGNNIIRDMEEAGKTKPEAKKYLAYLTKHNIM